MDGLKDVPEWVYNRRLVYHLYLHSGGELSIAGRPYTAVYEDGSILQCIKSSDRRLDCYMACKDGHMTVWLGEKASAVSTVDRIEDFLEIVFTREVLEGTLSDEAFFRYGTSANARNRREAAQDLAQTIVFGADLVSSSRDRFRGSRGQPYVPLEEFQGLFPGPEKLTVHYRGTCARTVTVESKDVGDLAASLEEI